MEKIATLPGVPTDLASIPGSDLALVTPQEGLVYAIGTSIGADLVLDLRDKTVAGGEAGLLGVSVNDKADRVFVLDTTRHGDVELRSYPMSTGAVVDASHPTTIARFEGALSGHYGGDLERVSGGHLLVSLGDRGGVEHGSGSVLSIDTEAPGTDPRPVATGLRNPWRISFDPVDEQLWIADVGESAFEEIDVTTLGSEHPPDFGWPRFEGTTVHDPDVPESDAVAPPVHVREHGDEVCAIVGVGVARGPLAALRGKYLFGDYCSRDVYSIDAGTRPVERVESRVATLPERLASAATVDDGRRVFLLGVDGGVYSLGDGRATQRTGAPVVADAPEGDTSSTELTDDGAQGWCLGRYAFEQFAALSEDPRPEAVQERATSALDALRAATAALPPDLESDGDEVLSFVTAVVGELQVSGWNVMAPGVLRLQEAVASGLPPYEKVGAALAALSSIEVECAPAG